VLALQNFTVILVFPRLFVFFPLEARRPTEQTDVEINGRTKPVMRPITAKYFYAVWRNGDVLQVTSSVAECVLNIRELEERFVQLMTCGVMTYSRPLRHRILTVTQHRALFQNVEKVRLVNILLET